MEPTKLAKQINDLTSAYDERKRLFDKLRNLNLDDDAITAIVKEYGQAAKEFDNQRANLIKS